MASKAESWWNAISRAAEELESLDPRDRQGIVRVGACIEELLESAPAKPAEAAAALSDCLAALQAAYENGGDAQRRCRPLADLLRALIAARGGKGEPGTLALARRALSDGPPAGGGPAAGASAAEGGAAEGPAADTARRWTLHEIAASLVTLESGERDKLEALRRALAGLDETTPPSARQAAADAAVRLESFLAKGEIGEAELAQLGDAIDAALQCQEDAETGKAVAAPPAGAAPPKAKASPVSPPPAAAVPPMAEASPASPPPAAASAAPPSFGLPEDSDPQLVEEFVTESLEYLENAESALLDLEADPANMDAVNRVFRAFHTVKGTSGFLNLPPISELAHKAETLLSRVRDGQVQFTQRFASLSLRSVDLLKELLAVLRQGVRGGEMALPAAYAPLLAALMDPERAEAEAAAPGRAAAPAAGAAARNAGGEAPMEGAAAPSRSARGGDSESSVRVRTERLDRLIDMVGELVIAHSMVAQDDLVSSASHHELSRKVSHAGKIVRELQDLSMAMRMVPLKSTFQKMARLVRDLSVKQGKPAEFQFEGEDTEIDRNMVDLVNDPLVHMMRNAMDHGLEPPAEREAAGKRPEGLIRLVAFHAGGNVLLQLTDDGRGLDRDRILRKAVDKGIVDRDAALSDAEIYNLIFAAGFSTAERVTEVSGRGVGMDVVRRNIELLHGRVDISSTPGAGTRFTIRLPLTMAITDGMLIRVGVQRYIVPTLNIQMSLRPEPGSIATVGKRGEMIKLMGDLIPLYRLHRIFGIPGAMEDAYAGLVLIMDDGDQRFAVLVDELLGKLQVVAKSLGTGLGRVPGISGSAILGDGRVGLILDPAGLRQLARGIDAMVAAAGGACASV